MGEKPTLFINMELEELRTKMVEIIESLQPFYSNQYTLIDVELYPKGIRLYVKILVNKPGGINIDECAYLNNIIGHSFDEKDIIMHSYTLEVSSPGIDRPLKEEKEFRCLIGRVLKVKMKDGRTILARLKDVEEKTIVLENKNGLINIAIDDIELAMQEVEGI